MTTLAERIRWSGPITWAFLALLLFVAGAVTAGLMSAVGSSSPSSAVPAGGSCRPDRRPLLADGCDLRAASFAKAELSRSALRGALLDAADLSHANLAGAQLAGASLRGADLRWACLRGADLDRADLTGADLAGADLAGARTSGITGLPKLAAPDAAC